MRVDVKGLARDVCRCNGKSSGWFSHQPGYESDYLMFRFVLPCLRGEPPCLRELDLEAFHYEEIDDLDDFVQNHYETKSITIPCGLAEMATMSQPRVRHGRAFC